MDASSILRIVPFAESINETSAAIYALEAECLRGSSIIVEGITTGTALVRAKLSHPTFQDVQSDEVKLLVIDNLIIIPSRDVYIMINTAVKYTVKRFRQNSMIDVEMPSTQFEFVLSNTTVAVLHEPSSNVIGRVLGYTQVTLVDKNMKDQISTRQPTVGIYVNEPDHLGFSITSGDVWILESKREYFVTVNVFDKLNHKLYVGGNIQITTEFPKSHFDVSYSSDNGSYHETKTLTSGKIVLHAVLSKITLFITGEIVVLDPPVRGKQNVIIYNPVTVTPAVLAFPWIPNGSDHYKYQLEATGGSGQYSWSSDATTIASVNIRGLLTTTADTGFTIVKAHDTENLLHYGQSKVYILPPDNLKFVPSRVEVEIGTKLKIPLAAAAFSLPESDDLLFFDDCRKMNLTISVTDPSIFQVLGTSDEFDDIITPGCTSVYLKALRQGYVIVTAGYQYKNITIKATVTVAAYLPLKALDPVDIAVVTLGSAKNFIIQGGPQPWVHDRSTHYEKVNSEKLALISIRTDVIPQHPFGEQSSLHYYHVTCKELGEQNIVVTIGNNPSKTNSYPASSNITLRFACMIPATLNLEPDVQLPEITDRTFSLQDCQSPNKEFHVRSPQDLKLRISLRDNKNRLFDNFTSLEILWTSSNYDMASFDRSNETDIEMTYEEDMFGPYMKMISYQVCQLKVKQGSVTIKSTIMKYRVVILRNAGVGDEENLKKHLSASIKLSLTSDIRIEPTQAAIFNHPFNKVELRIFGGSGKYQVKGSDDDIASLSSLKSSVKITPKMTGIYTLTVYDQCLDSPNPAMANIRISDIDRILVTVVDKVELGHVINCSVMVIDELNNPLLVSQLDLLNLTPRLSRDLVNVKLSGKSGLDTTLYILRGVAIGNTILTYTAHPANKPQITSEPKHVQVFPPLKLDPRYIILIPGATFQLIATGGPYPQVTTLFNIKNDSVASVSSVGLITARIPGKTFVTGLVEANDPQSGHAIIFSEDHVIVEVIRLTGIKIYTPSSNVVTNTETALRAVGLNDETPFSFGNIIPHLEFHWSSSNIDVCKLKSLYDKSGVTVDYERPFRVVLSCKHPGEVIIKLKAVFADPTYEQAILTADLFDDVRIQVYEKLQLVVPRNGHLLLPHDVTTRIKTKRDGGRLSYSIMNVCSQSRDKDSQALLTIDHRGHVKTGMISGTAGIVVTSREDFGVNQTVVVHVEVKSVLSISLEPLSSVYTLFEKHHALPVGITAIFSISLHDNIGRKFDSANVYVKHRLNRFDSIHVTQGQDNGTYSIRAHNDGEAILNVWLVSSPHIVDFIHLKATEAITPFTPIYYLGEMICFKETVIGDEDSGVWWTSKENVLNIDGVTGVAMATGSGNTLVYYNASSWQPTYIEVKVVLSDVDIYIEDIKTISNSLGPNINGSYLVRVDFASQRKTPLTGCSDVIIQNEPAASSVEFPFSCSLSFEHFTSLSVNNVFYVKPGYKLGKSACFIFTRTLSKDDAILLTSSQPNLIITVTLSDKDNAAYKKSKSTELDFYPSFVLEKHEVFLSALSPVVTVKIFASDDMMKSLKVSVSSSLISANIHYGNVAYVDISLVDTKISTLDDVTIEINSDLTFQSETVTIVFQSTKPTPAASLNTNNVKEQCLGPDCQKSSIFTLDDALLILLPLFVILWLFFVCRPVQRIPPPSRTSPYLYQSPYPNHIFMDDAYCQCDVSPGRRRHSPILGRRTPGSSPRDYLVSLNNQW
ncbi:nuclear pore membrane glycoprotein 210-like isoform X1 [Xenia sp. Carnegie-2017]|uniref:nuclear pore membrane glycoprotein 210-like isoform X1 n=2 Tax=Xenia sp. Carnegie-2017 TaxID=2897299 RepID=UPI001F045665|nr:nuclear pore membrane glycoprotein 210-like isoform X1 [Xenia sp. Carnegie-2017]